VSEARAGTRPVASERRRIYASRSSQHDRPNCIVPAKDPSEWEKHHDCIERRRVARVSVSPEEAGWVGCWQFVAVQRERIPPDPKKEPTTEVGYYATSLMSRQMGDQAITGSIRGHGSAIENGVHHRRDVSFGEDRCRVRNRQAAEVLATFRNLEIALYELDLERGQARARSMGTWMKRQTFGKALGLLKG